MRKNRTLQPISRFISDAITMEKQLQWKRIITRMRSIKWRHFQRL